MRYIGHTDSNGTLIFEGDTLEITEAKDLNFFSDDFINKIQVDQLKLKILNLNGYVGVDIECHFYKNGKQVLFSDEYNFFKDLISDEDEQKSFDEHYRNKDLSSPLTYVYKSNHSSSFLYHGFIHRKSKTIIESEVPIQGREELVRDFLLSQLNVSVNGEAHCALRTKFLVELTEDSKERILKANDSLYEPIRYEGEFTHLLLKPKKVDFDEYDLECIPLDKNGNKSLYEVSHSYKKYSELRKPIRIKWRKRIDEWKESNKHLTDDEINSHIKSMWDEAKKEYEPLENCKETEEKTLLDTIFLGLCSGSNLFDFFDQMKCKVSIVE